MDKATEISWFTVAFIIWVFFVYLAVSYRPSQTDSDIQQPSEFEIRGGNYWK